MTSWIGFRKLANVIFGITQKPLCSKSYKFLKWWITKKGIFLNMFSNPMKLGTSSRSLMFYINLSIKRERGKSKEFRKSFKFLVHIDYFGLLIKIKTWSGTRISYTFFTIFSHKHIPHLILYQLTMFQYQTYFPSQDIKQYALLNSYFFDHLLE